MPHFLFAFDHLARAAGTAISFRRSGVSLFLRAVPPLRPNATAFASFLINFFSLSIMNKKVSPSGL